MASNSDGGTRKLAAIMFTDVKDFSKKMGENEVAAMEVLRIHDDLMREICAKHRGIVIKSIGDSFMVDFSSAVNAVQCAIEAQERLWEYNKGKSEFESIQIRVGIHLGDIINVGNDIYGDGVNIAARIQAITEATRICISSEIYNQVKNKLPIKVFSIGMTDLKNIAEPVEVFEILLESIPELSTPSKSAQSLPTRKRAEQISKQEEEEAKKVEAARLKLDAEEAERRERADVHYKKAMEHFQADQIPKAEEEIKEIYKIVQIHYEAQMLLIQIEERRAQLEEEDRKRRVKEEKLRKEEERKQRIQKILDVALQFIDQEQFSEALNALQEVYTLEPNNEQAKRIEKQVKLAEEAKLERQRQEAAAEEERQREEATRLERQRAEELAAAALQRAAARKEVKAKPKSKMKLYIVAGVGVVIVAAVALLLFTQGPLAKPSSVAVIPFTATQSENESTGTAFGLLLADELARVEGLSVLAPTSARFINLNNSNTQKLATSFSISHILRGSLSVSGTAVTVNASCTDLNEGKTVWEGTFQGDLRDLHSLAAKAATAWLQSSGTEMQEPTHSRLSENSEAVASYLQAISLMIQPGPEPLSRSIASLREALARDSLMLAARGALGKALLEQYCRDGERDQALLLEALPLAQMAASSDPTNAQAHATLAKARMFNQQFAQSRLEAERSLALQPGLPDAQRTMAMLLLSEGKSEEALDYATKAQKGDPRWYESPYVLGMIHMFKAQCEDINQRKPQAEAASQLLDQAIQMGGPDSSITFSASIPAWLAADQEDRIIAACQRQLEHSDDRGKVRLYYQIGRTFQLKGKLNESTNNLSQATQIADRITTQDRKDFVIFAYYALSLTRSGKVADAGRYMQAALTLAPSNAEIRYTAARMHAVNRKNAEAFKELATAVSMRFDWKQILNTDFLSISTDPQFLATIARKTR